MSDWRPTAAIEVLRLRADLLARARAFFAERGVLEVDTPALSAATVTDLHLTGFKTCYHGPGPRSGGVCYLHTSPEFPMKRLLAAGSGPIYQFAKVFRDGEAGARHNPEFTLLEWYRPGFDHHRLMLEVAELMMLWLAPVRTLAAPEFVSYRELFQTRLGFDPHTASGPELAGCARQQGLTVPGLDGQDTDGWLDLLVSHCIEPTLGDGRLSFVYDYPASQSALARIRPGQPPLAERFELYLDGIELANGFHELADAEEQQRRFEQDNTARRQRGLPTMPIDQALLAALPQLPDCAGVALGFDRLVMIAAGCRSISEVLTFPFDRA